MLSGRVCGAFRRRGWLEEKGVAGVVRLYVMRLYVITQLLCRLRFHKLKNAKSETDTAC